MEKDIKHIVVVGGGTAGWLTASLIRAELACQSIEVTLIESPDIPTIGVGEGTWPSMRQTLARIGFPESLLFTDCNASFKQGSLFLNWSNDDVPHRYHHPFTAPWQTSSIDTSLFWSQRAKETLPFAHAVNAQARLIEMNIAPKDITTPEYAAIHNYGYHFDAGLFVKRLTEFAVSTLGVRRITANVTHIHEDSDGFITRLSTDEREQIDGDFFIDCSGQHGLLIDKHSQIPFISVKRELFNDRAIALQVPYEETDSPIASATVATAYENGWVWDIGLQHRRGIGFVYSSQFCSDEQALSQLHNHIQYVTNQSPLGKPKFIQFNPGYREKFWHKNILAIGMAAGFVEPLEASALVMIEQAAKFFVDHFPHTQEQLALCETRYNHLTTERWRDIVDFLKLHYVLSKRTSDYWLHHHNPDTHSPRLTKWLTHWKTHRPSRFDLPQIESLFPSASFEYILHGMGFKQQLHLTQSERAIVEQTEKEYGNLINEAKRLLNLPTNRSLLNKIAIHGLPKI